MEIKYKTTGYPTDVPEETLWAHCRLILLIEDRRVHYVLISDEDIIIYGKVFHAPPHAELAGLLTHVFVSEPSFAKHTKESIVITATDSFTLIPDEYRNQQSWTRLSHTLLDDMASDQAIHTTWLPSMNAWALFTFPESLTKILDTHLSKYLLRHVCFPMVQISMQVAVQAPSHMLVLVQSGNMLITACKANQIHLCNSYPFKKAQDISYFLQSILRVLGLNSHIPIYLMGDSQGSILPELAQAYPNIKSFTLLHHKVGNKLSNTPIQELAFMMA